MNCMDCNAQDLGVFSNWGTSDEPRCFNCAAVARGNYFATL